MFSSPEVQSPINFKTYILTGKIFLMKELKGTSFFDE
jgi:hypothetical protein